MKPIEIRVSKGITKGHRGERMREITKSQLITKNLRLL
jgi:hypothetical protein